MIGSAYSRRVPCGVPCCNESGSASSVPFGSTIRTYLLFHISCSFGGGFLCELPDSAFVAWGSS